MIYDPKRSDNEEKSAELLQKRILKTSFPSIQSAADFIMATANHVYSTNDEVNLFVDIDLQILGSSWQLYEKYMQAIKEEYNFLSDDTFCRKRVAVLQSFLSRESMFLTTEFQSLYESKARENISREIEVLTYDK